MELKKLGRFEILQELGAGGMGVVYKGRDPKINRLVALKVIRNLAGSRSSDAEQALQRFYVEAQSAGQLSHQNIVTIYDVGEEDTKDGKVVYIAMEFLDGKGLDHYIENDLFPSLADKVKIIRQIAEGLDYAHKRDIVHRDVKPANIMVTQDGVPKLTDFGLARFSDSSLTMSGTILGTPNYMAPEQVQGKKVDARSDFFALTTIFYEMLTSEKPFAGDTITTVIYRVVNEEPIPPSKLNPGISTSFDAFIAKGLTKNRDKRFQNGGEYIRALEALYAEVTGLAPAGAASAVFAPGDNGATMALDAKKAREASSPRLAVTPPKTGGNTMLIGGAAAGVVALGLVGYLVFGGSEKKEEPAPAVAAVEQPAEPAKAETAVPAAPVAVAAAPAAPLAPAPAAAKPAPVPAQPAAPAPAPVQVAKPAPPKPAAVAQGYLTVQSEPKSAEVFLGGKFLGLTPINKVQTSKGSFDLKITKSGYAPYLKSVRVEENTVITAALEKSGGAAPAAETEVPGATGGALVIKAPAESVIFVDGREYREETLKLSDLLPGSHLVYVQMKGRKPFTDRVSIVAGRTHTVDLR